MSGVRRGGRRGKPFGGGQSEVRDTTGVSDQLLKNARKTGQLNLSNRSLCEVPEKIWRINLDAASEARETAFDSDERWWDQVELTKLILASNKLQVISADIKLLSSLASLDVHDNDLSELPASLGELSALQRINASHNKMEELPSSLSGCQELRYLHVEHNSLRSLPDDLFAFPCLEDLDLSHNKLTAIPTSIGQLQNLSSLNISFNQLTSVPDSLQYLKGVRILDLNNNQITSLPDQLGLMRSLQQLYVRHNKIQNFPTLTHCTELKELHLGNNQLTKLNAEHLQPLVSLSVLDLRDNKICVVPDEITVLTLLERLDITNNDVSGLPYELGNMTHLKSLAIDGNPMRAIRRDIIARGSEGIKKYLRSRVESPAETKNAAAVQHGSSGQSGLIGGGDQIDAHSVKQSKSLDFSGKKAAEIPEDVWELGVTSQVAEVNFSKNQLKQWPEKLSLLADSVTHLNLGFNRIQAVLPDISMFTRLADLDLRNNSLQSLPDEMSSLSTLRTLTLSFNRFIEIPSVIYKLKNIENLLISDNQVGHIDANALLGLEKLSSLDLQNNNLSNIPPELGNCVSLRSLLLMGNPCRNPRPAILNKGTVALLEYLRGRIVH